MERLTPWEELDYADAVVISFGSVADLGADPDPDVWAEMHASDVDWTAGWIDARAVEATYRPGVDEPLFILERTKTTVCWGADAAHLQVTVLVGEALFAYAPSKGLDQLGTAIKERLGGDRGEPLSVDVAVSQARQRLTVRYSTDGSALVLIETRDGDGRIEVTLREPDGSATYALTMREYGRGASSISCVRHH